MGRVPVARTLAQAYGLLLGRFFATFGLVWLPATFLGLAINFALTRLVVPLTNIGTAGPAAKLALIAAWGSAFVVVLILLAAIAVPVARDALGRREGRVAAHFVLGGREIGLVAAQIRFYLLLFVTVVAVGALAAAATNYGLSPFADANAARGSSLATWHGLPILALTGLASLFAAGIALILVSARLGFFLIPIAALEDKVRLSRALAISRGNIGRVTIASAMLPLPIAALVFGAAYALYGAGLPGFVHVSLETVLAFVLGHAAAIATLTATTLALLTVLFSTASASAYQALAPARATIAEWHRNEVREGPDLPPHKDKTKPKDEALVSSEPSPLQGDFVFAAEERIAALAESQDLKAAEVSQVLAAKPAPVESVIADDPVREAVDAHLASLAAVHPLATFHTLVAAAPASEQPTVPPPPTLIVPDECPVANVHERASEEAWEKMAAAAVQAQPPARTNELAAARPEAAEEEFELVEEPLPEEPVAEQPDEAIATAKEAA